MCIQAMATATAQLTSERIIASRKPKLRPGTCAPAAASGSVSERPLSGEDSWPWSDTFILDRFIPLVTGHVSNHANRLGRLGEHEQRAAPPGKGVRQAAPRRNPGGLNEKGDRDQEEHGGRMGDHGEEHARKREQQAPEQSTPHLPTIKPARGIRISANFVETRNPWNRSWPI